MTTHCSKCNEPCEIIEEQHFDWEEFWGSPVKRYYYEEYSDCCHADLYELEEEEK